MSNLEYAEFEGQLPQPNVKKDIERTATDIWTGDFTPESLSSFDNPWALHEIASKTHFQDTEHIEEFLMASETMCDDCRTLCLCLIQDKQHMPADVFVKDDCCLLEWKQAMRADHHSDTENEEPQLDFTITIVKPGAHSDTKDALLSVVGEDAVISSTKKKLTLDDIAFLYTSAYGADFIKNLTEYMTADEVEILLLHTPAIGELQNNLKKQVRRNLQTTDPLRNNIHFPDSFHESLAQSVYFFPELSKVYARP